jgi:hypothetical protein
VDSLNLFFGSKTWLFFAGTHFCVGFDEQMEKSSEAANIRTAGMFFKVQSS